MRRRPQVSPGAATLAGASPCHDHSFPGKLDIKDLRVYDWPRMQEGSTIHIELIRSRDAGWIRAHIPSIPAYGDGETAEEALADLRNSLAGYVEAFGIPDILARICG